MFYVAYQTDAGWRIMATEQTESEARRVFDAIVIAEPIYAKAIITDKCRLIDVGGEFSVGDTKTFKAIKTMSEIIL